LDGKQVEATCYRSSDKKKGVYGWKALRVEIADP